MVVVVVVVVVDVVLVTGGSDVTGAGDSAGSAEPLLSQAATATASNSSNKARVTGRVITTRGYRPRGPLRSIAPGASHQSATQAIADRISGSVIQDAAIARSVSSRGWAP